MINFGENFEIKDLNMPKDALPFNMLWVEPGEYTMGSNAAEIEYMYMHTPVIYSFKNIITKGFWLGQFIVTQAHWKALDLPLVAKKKHEEYGKEHPRWRDNNNLHIFLCAWPEAMQFCRELNIRYKKYLPKGYHFSLPLESHWEYCCKAGLKGDYKELNKNEPRDMTSYEHIREIKLDRPNEPNTWGFYEMLSNVSEMCFDIPHEYPYEDLIAEQEYPRIGEKFIDWGSKNVVYFSVGDRIVRGNISCRYRYAVIEDQRFLDLGFRVALRPITETDINDEWIKKNNINMLG